MPSCNGTDRARLISGSINNLQRKLADVGLVTYREKSRRTSSKGVTQMTAKQNNVDAAPDRNVGWHQINWAKCHQETRKLQVRIAKAVKEGNTRKAKALQWLLTHSYAAKVVAVKRVTENAGKRTPGVDGEIWSTPAAKLAGIRLLNRRGYQPLPLRRVYIPKSNGKPRPLGIPAMKDRAMQALHLLALEPAAETTADKNSYGFRPERSTHDAVEQVFKSLAQKGCAEWILEGDIKGCFDHINHDWMLNNILTDTQVLKKWLKSGVIDEGKLFPTNEGTPQGGIISPVLANLVLDGLQPMLEERFGTWSRKQNQYIKNKVNFVRYADDFVITGTSKELLEDQVKPLVKDFLASRGLELSEEKTKVTHVVEGFDFLGQNIRQYGKGKKKWLLVTPSHKNVKTFLSHMRTTIKANATAKVENLIGLLNPKIRGWSDYHKHVVAKKTFNEVDNQIWHAIYRWARRRHPNKGGKWVAKTYFGKRGNQNWAFRAEVMKDGRVQEKFLRRCDETPIKRHVKIIKEASPYDPSFGIYFEERQGVKLAANLTGRRKLLAIWERQKGHCPVCGLKITTVTKWHLHSLVRKVDGGTDRTSNLYLLHPNCHRQHHLNPLQRWVQPALSEDGV